MIPLQRPERTSMEDDEQTAHVRANHKDYTYDMFIMNMSPEPEEVELFGEWVDTLNERHLYSFEAVRDGAQRTEVELTRQDGQALQVLNFSSYNYLGFSYHPEVIEAARDAVSRYGLGAASSPVISGTYRVHAELEAAIVAYFGLPDRAVSLFSSGYAVNLGVIQAFIKPGNHVVMDRAAHMSIVDGAKLSGGTVSVFEHNDMADLERVLKDVCDGFTRVLVCIEGVYSGDGDFGKVRDTVRLAKRYGAFTLVDEAHSALIAGETGRGVCEAQGVLDDVDFYVMTFSKAFGGVGGAVYARRAMCRYINWYAKARMFSCALDPAVTGGMARVVALAAGPEGQARRSRLLANAALLRDRLRGKVDLGVSESWVVTVQYGQDRLTLDVSDHLQRHGLDTSLIQFPAAPRNQARIRLFVSSEHTAEQLERAAAIVLDTATRFGFRTG